MLQRTLTVQIFNTAFEKGTGLHVFPSNISAKWAGFENPIGVTVIVLFCAGPIMRGNCDFVFRISTGSSWKQETHKTASFVK